MIIIRFIYKIHCWEGLSSSQSPIEIIYEVKNLSFLRLPEPDRLQQLSDMKSSHAALLDDLNRLPVSKDTRRVIEKRREIEGEKILKYEKI